MKDKLVIALTPGENHFQYVDHLIDSIVSKLTIDYHVCLISPTPGLTINHNKDKVTVKDLRKEDKEYFEEIYAPESRGDIGSFVYMQLLVPDYFDEYDKILFLEVDQYVQKDLAPMWREMHDQNVNLGAVPVNIRKEIPPSFRKPFPNKHYYNTGVVVHDVAYWKQHNLRNLCFNECVKQKQEGGQRFRFYVQGAMNHALSDHFHPINHNYNFMGLGFYTDLQEQDLNNASILHWNGTRKPWADNGLYKNRYYK